MIAFGVFSSHVKKVDSDPDKCVDRRGLGSYCSLVVKGFSRPVQIVTCYRPGKPSRHKTTKRGKQSVYM